MKDLKLIELQTINGGGISDTGGWLIDKIGDLFCKCKKLDFSPSGTIYGPTGNSYPQ